MATDPNAWPVACEIWATEVNEPPTGRSLSKMLPELSLHTTTVSP
jgi:hypothetical protein